MTVPELVDGDTVLLVHVACWETVAGLITGLSIPVAHIAAARAAAPWSSQTEHDLCAGLRVGLGIPFIKVLGRKVRLTRAPVFVDCCAGSTPLLVVDLLPGKSHYRRLVITTDRAEELAKRICAGLPAPGDTAGQAAEPDAGAAVAP